jgi:hypothetical protein
MNRFGIPYDPTDNVRELRAISWKYQIEIVKATPRPKHFIEVCFEDFVLEQDRTLKNLEQYLGIPLKKIPVRPESVGRWKQDTEKHDFDFLQETIPSRSGIGMPPYQGGMGAGDIRLI